MSTPSDLRIERLSPVLQNDFLQYFDHDRGSALADFTARDLALVDAFPSSATTVDAADAEYFHRALPMFIVAGFSSIARHQRTTVVRKALRNT